LHGIWVKVEIGVILGHAGTKDFVGSVIEGTWTRLMIIKRHCKIIKTLKLIEVFYLF